MLCNLLFYFRRTSSLKGAYTNAQDQKSQSTRPSAIEFTIASYCCTQIASGCAEEEESCGPYRGVLSQSISLPQQMQASREQQLQAHSI
jgi:hypothetical protein